KAIKKTLDDNLGALWLYFIGLFAGVSFLLDLYSSFSVFPLTLSICGLIWIGIGFRLMKRFRSTKRLILLGLSLFSILAFKYIDWNSRRPFIRDLLKIESGMTPNEVNIIMKRYDGGSSPDELFYMHKVPGPFYSDIGVVKLKD